MIESPSRIALVTWVVLIWLAMAFLPALSKAGEPLRLETQAGQCKYGIAQHGVWHNRDYATDIDRRDTCYQIGFSRISRQYNFGDVGWRLSYVNLGSLHADNQFAMQDEQQFERFDPKKCDLPTGKNCIGRGVISQRTWGISGTGLLERRLYDVTVGAEAGVFAYYSVFDVAVFSGPRNTYVNSFHWGDWTVTPVVGVNMRHGYLPGAVRYYGSIRASEGCPGCDGITAGPTWAFQIGLHVPLQ